MAILLRGDDVEGDSLSYMITAGPLHGTLAGIPPNLTYTPFPNFCGEDNVRFKVNDGLNDSTEAIVTIFVTPVNDPPTTADQTFTLSEDSFIQIPDTASDIDGDALTFVLVQPPAHGFVSSFGTTLFYIPDPDFSGTDSFAFKFSDWSSESTVAMSTAIVNPVNDAPTATNQIPFELEEDTTITVPALVGDVDGDALTFLFFIPPEHGTVIAVGSNFVYTPNLNYNGWDYFMYQPVDGAATGNIAGVEFHIRPVNDAPLATNRFLVTAEETPVSTMLDLVAEPDFDPVSIIIVSGPSHGTLSPGYLYTPELNFTGTDSFTFKYNDGLVDGNVATVTINVTPVNDLPVAADLSLTTTEDTPIAVSLAGSDVDGELTYIIVTDPWRGTLTGSGANRTYVPRLNLNGTDSFTYKVSDGQAESATAIVTISVTPVNDPPIPMIGLILGWEDTAQPVLLMARDVEDSAFTYSILIGPTNGTLTGTIPNLLYTPFPNAFGEDRFTYRTFDSELLSVDTQARIYLEPRPDAPTANAQSLTTPYNTPLAFVLSGNDVDGDPLSYTILTVPENGTLTGSAPNLVFTPSTSWIGSTSLTFRVNDGMSNSAPAIVTITVQAPMAVPAAPSGLTATTVSSSQINLTWTDNSGYNEDGFKIERSTPGNSWTQIATVGANITSYANTGLAANKNHSYRVRAYNVLGNSPYSSTDTTKTLR